MNKFAKTKNILNIVLGAFVVLTSLVMFILSYEIYKDEYGTDISFNSDYVVSLLIGLIILFYGIISLKGGVNGAYEISGMLSGSLIGFYSLGVFFKAFSKAVFIKKVAFDYVANQTYLYIGLLGLIILAFYAVSYFAKKETK